MVVISDETGHEDTAVLARRPSIRMRDRKTEDDTWWSRIKRVLRVIRRLCKLAFVFTPVVALYPLHWITSRTLDKARALSTITWTASSDNISGTARATTTDAHQLVLMGADENLTIGWYYQLCLYCVEWSGAACIKIMQWAGTRPDMFGREFCAVFSKLQDSTRPHSYKHTVAAMVDAYGPDWESKIRLEGILGSGCIAQVYKGAILVDESIRNDEIEETKIESNAKDSRTPRERPVAVKVMHPCVEDDIDADLDIMRLSIRILEQTNLGPIKNLKWLNLPGFIEEMAVMLKTQLDLRKEGEHLVRFNENFAGNPTIKFPKLIEGYPPTQRVLCETYCDGVPLNEFVRNNKGDQKLLTVMCQEAIKAVCQMIFLDNFTHGDLHPGNVLVTDDYKFVLLDVGITTIHSDTDHKLVSDVLAAFIRKNGRKAGRHMIDNSNSRLKSVGEHSIGEEEFIRKIERISEAASGENYFMQHLGTYISYICNAASTHHVMLNQAFISSALAVKVQEGIALALDPSVEIWKIAIPIIMEGERRHGRVGERAKELLQLPTVDGVVEWLTGKKTIRYQVYSDDDPYGKERVVVYSAKKE